MIELINIKLVFNYFSDGIISYSAPEGSEPSLGLMDISYDGQKDNGFLQGGLGRLVDGEIGMDNFRLDIGVGKGLHLFEMVPGGVIPISFTLCRKRLGGVEE